MQNMIKIAGNYNGVSSVIKVRMFFSGIEGDFCFRSHDRKQKSTSNSYNTTGVYFRSHISQIFMLLNNWPMILNYVITKYTCLLWANQLHESMPIQCNIYTKGRVSCRPSCFGLNFLNVTAVQVDELSLWLIVRRPYRNAILVTIFLGKK